MHDSYICAGMLLIPSLRRHASFARSTLRATEQLERPSRNGAARTSTRCPAGSGGCFVMPRGQCGMLDGQVGRFEPTERDGTYRMPRW
jgi:hypothetical protein